MLTPSSAEGIRSGLRERRPEPGEQEGERGMLRRARSGAAGACEEFVRRFTPGLLATARLLLGEETPAREAVRDALTTVLASPGFPATGTRLADWLRSLVIGSAIRRPGLDDNDEVRALEPLLPSFDDAGHRIGPAPVVRPLAGAGNRERVRACIDRLPPAHRTVLLLCDVERLDFTAAASALGYAVATVRQYHRRARLALVTLLGEEASGSSHLPQGQ